MAHIGEHQFEIIKLKTEVTAIKLAMKMIVGALSHQSPPQVASILRRSLPELKLAPAIASLEGLTPEQSDMFLDEIQTIFDSLADGLLAMLPAEKTQK